MRGSSYSDRPKSKTLITIGRTILMSLLLGSLFCLDFVLYLRAGNVLNGAGLYLPALIAMAYLLGAACALMVVTFFSKFLQSLLFAICGTVLAVALMNQFLQIDKSQYLGVLLTSLTDDPALAGMVEDFANWILFGVIFLVLYIIVSRLSLKSTFTLALVLWATVGTLAFMAMMNGTPKPALEEVYKSTETNFAAKNKTIFLFMPNAVSQVAMPEKSDKAKLLKNIELGFFAKYRFKLYPHAYVKNDSRYSNLIETLNILDTKTSQFHLMGNVGLEKLWKFNTTQKPEVFLKDNQLPEVFQKAHYRVNAYQNGRLEICKENNQFAVDTCIQKGSLPIDIKDFSEADKVSLLLNQWLGTIDVLYDPSVISTVDMFLDRNIIKEASLPYEQLYVVQSFQTLKNVLEDIAANSSKAGVYFVYLDFPNNLFVYDEQCNIKPLSRWETDNSKAKSKNNSQNADAYADQMLCFWNKMEDFMQNLINLDEYDHLTLIINGISSGGESAIKTYNFVDQFKKQNTVLFAIHDPQTKFSINNRVCSTKDILRTYLFKAPQCKEFDGLESMETMQDNIRTDLVRNKITQKDVTKALQVYKEKLNEKQKEPEIQKNKEEVFDVAKVETPVEEQKPEVSENELISDDAVRALTGGEAAVPQQPEQVQSDEASDNQQAPAEEQPAIQKQQTTEAKVESEEVPLGRVEEVKEETTEEAQETTEEVQEIEEEVQKITEQEQASSVDIQEEMETSENTPQENEEEIVEEIQSSGVSFEPTEDTKPSVTEETTVQIDEEVIEKESVAQKEEPSKEKSQEINKTEPKVGQEIKKVEKPAQKQPAQVEKPVSVTAPTVNKTVTKSQAVQKQKAQTQKKATQKTTQQKATQKQTKQRKVAPKKLKVTVSAPSVRELEAAPDLNNIILQNSAGEIIHVQKSEQPVIIQESEPQVINESSTPAASVIHSEVHSDLSGDFLIIEESEEWEYDPAKALGVSGEESEENKVIVKIQ